MNNPMTSTDLNADFWPQGEAPSGDRRSSPRVPIDGPVRMGPPQGVPYATVSAHDLSAHGLFIDADRPVKVGVRFSLEIPLGEARVLVPEAEVAYNRSEGHLTGFGVRFVDAPAAVREAISAHVEAAARPRTLIPVEVPSSFRARAAEGLPSAMILEAISSEIRVNDTQVAPAASEFEVELPDEPALDTPILDEPSRLRILAEDTRDKFRDLGALWSGVLVLGATATLVVGGVFLWAGASAEAVEPVKLAKERIHPSTQTALMGGQPATPMVAAAEKPVTKGEVKNPLPPLVMVDEENVTEVEISKKEANAGVATETKAAPKVEAKVEPKVEAKVEPKVEAKVEPKVEAKVEPKVEAKVEPKAEAKVEPKVEAKVEAKVEPKADAKEAKVAAKPMSEKAQQILGEAPQKLVLKGLDQGATVLKTYVFKAPDRFVIDVAGQNAALALPSGQGGVKGVRAGKHPGHTRVVVDTSRAIESGQVTRQGDSLVINLRYR